MAVYFFDASGAVKRYVAEQGHAWMLALCDPGAMNTLLIAQATLVEAVAAFCRKARDPDLTLRIGLAERDALIAQFRRDTVRDYDVVVVDAAVYTRAADLCRAHPLRAYDAVQLAAALTARDALAIIGLEPTFVSADRQLLAAAAAEGLAVDDLNVH